MLDYATEQGKAESRTFLGFLPLFTLYAHTPFILCQALLIYLHELSMMYISSHVFVPELGQFHAGTLPVECHVKHSTALYYNTHLRKTKMGGGSFPTT